VWYLEAHPQVEGWPIPIDVDLNAGDIPMFSDSLKLPYLRTPLSEDGKVNIHYEKELDGSAKAFHLDAQGEDSAEGVVETSMTITRGDAEVLACNCIAMGGEYKVTVSPTEDMIGKSAEIKLTLQNDFGSVTVEFEIYILEKDEEEEANEEAEAEAEAEAEIVPFVVFNSTLTDEAAETNSTASNSTAQVDPLQE